MVFPLILIKNEIGAKSKYIGNRRQTLSKSKRRQKLGIEIENVVEILRAIGRRFAHPAELNEMIHNLAQIVSTSNAPLPQYTASE